MKNSISLMTVLLAGLAVLTSCNSLEVTLPKGPQGEQGIQGVAGRDGLSAYEIWVKSINDHAISDWTGGTEVTDFFKYLKGKDGLDGKDGKDGKSALDLWREYVTSGVEDPKNPGCEWDKNKISEKDFYDFLTGADGDDGSTPFIGDNGNWWIVIGGNPEDLGVPARGPKGAQGNAGTNGNNGISGESPYIGENGHWWIGDHDTEVPARGEKGEQGDQGEPGESGTDGQCGLSAYELWVADVTSEEGLVNPGNGVFDVEDYPKWPREAVSVEDFYHYLTGKDGKDGKDGRDGENVLPSENVVDTLYTERVDGNRYNVAPVIALSRTKDGIRTYEYVNPFSGGAAFIVTGPGMVIIPGCEVTFTTMDGRITYTKTSDASGYVYLTRSELPEWYDGAPTAADDSTNINSGVRPLSFSFGGKTVTDESEIALTCKVPYQVGLEMNLIDGSLRGRYSLARYEVRRRVEGSLEDDSFFLNSHRSLVNDYRGFGYLHNVPASYRYYRNEGAVKMIKEMYDSASSVSEGLPSSSSQDDQLLGFFSTVANLSQWDIPGYLRTVGSDSFESASFGDGSNPEVVDVYSTFTFVSKGALQLRRYKPDYGLIVSDDIRSVHVPYITPLPSSLDDASYVWKSGHTTLTFELDWDEIEKQTVADGYSGHWKGNQYVYDFIQFKAIKSRPTSNFSGFRAKGKFNGSSIDSKVTIEWRKPVVFTDIYDAFSVSIADVESSFVLFDGIGSSFSYDASDDDENGNGKAYMFDQEITKSEAL